MNNLTRARESKNWSKVKLSRLANVPQNMISFAEKLIPYGTKGKVGYRQIPYPHHLKQIADALGYTKDPATLLDEVEE